MKYAYIQIELCQSLNVIVKITCNFRMKKEYFIMEYENLN